MPVLAVNNLGKTYDSATAVRGVSFTVRAGEIVGLLGPNGAGKTTIFNMILAVLEPTAGVIEICGIDVAQRRSDALAQANFAAVYAQVPGNLSVEQNLRVFGMLYSTPNLEERIKVVLRDFDLERFARTKCGVLSSGEQTRVGIAKAMLTEPALLLLDEPTASLDPSTAQILREKIRAYADRGKGGVLWTSHNMHEVADMCDRVIFLSHGQTLLEGDPKTLPQEHGKADLEELFITVAREPLSLSES